MDSNDVKDFTTPAFGFAEKEGVLIAVDIQESGCMDEVQSLF